MKAVGYARENSIPFFGICYGLHAAAIEFARNVLGIREATTTELDPDTREPVIDLMEEQKKVHELGGTMRLGAYPCRLKEGSLAREIYGKSDISERHRHRYEFNNAYRAVFQENGMVASGVYEEMDLVEILEYPDHPFFIAVQFHPEFKSKPTVPHPIFRDFIRAAYMFKKGEKANGRRRKRK